MAERRAFAKAAPVRIPTVGLLRRVAGNYLTAMYRFWRTLMALAYVAAGINHFWHPAPYRAIMPPWLPAPALLVAVSGAAEILLGLGLLFPFSRRWAAWGLIALLLAVFPANVQMAINYYHSGHPRLWGALLRLPVQGLLIGWAWNYTRKRNPGAKDPFDSSGQAADSL